MDTEEMLVCDQRIAEENLSQISLHLFRSEVLNSLHRKFVYQLAICRDHRRTHSRLQNSMDEIEIYKICRLIPPNFGLFS